MHFLHILFVFMQTELWQWVLFYFFLLCLSIHETKPLSSKYLFWPISCLLGCHSYVVFYEIHIYFLLYYVFTASYHQL